MTGRIGSNKYSNEADFLAVLSPSRRARPSHDRALRRAFKLRGELGGTGGIGEYIPKPKGMRWRTYDRKLEEIAAAEEIVDAHLAAFLWKLDPRLG